MRLCDVGLHMFCEAVGNRSLRRPRQLPFPAGAAEKSSAMPVRLSCAQVPAYSGWVGWDSMNGRGAGRVRWRDKEGRRDVWDGWGRMGRTGRDLEERRRDGWDRMGWDGMGLEAEIVFSTTTALLLTSLWHMKRNLKKKKRQREEPRLRNVEVRCPLLVSLNIHTIHACMHTYIKYMHACMRRGGEGDWSGYGKSSLTLSPTPPIRISSKLPTCARLNFN